jgi:hypothetical protein
MAASKYIQNFGVEMSWLAVAEKARKGMKRNIKMDLREVGCM